jgi:hypothetical protein
MPMISAASKIERAAGPDAEDDELEHRADIERVEPQHPVLARGPWIMQKCASAMAIARATCAKVTAPEQMTALIRRAPEEGARSGS